MDFIVSPSKVRDAKVTVPGDKSVSHRALMLGSVAEGRTEVSGFLAGEDCLQTLAAMRAMGVTIEQPGVAELNIEGVGLHGLKAPTTELDLGNSGTAMRLMAGLLASQRFDSTLVGDASLTSRPMERVIAPLTRMGAAIDSDRDGSPPLQIAGGLRLHGIDYEMPVASAQVKSAVLLAGLYADGTTSVTEPNVTRDHTERMLRSMGAEVAVDGNRISIEGGQHLSGCRVQVPADLSSASFVILAALLAESANVLISNVGVNPTRTGVIDILQGMGGDICLENARLLAEEPVADIRVRSSKLCGSVVAPELVSLAIDEFPVLFVAAAAAAGKTVFSGIGELRVKESDRIAAMADGMRKLGIRVDESPDGAVVHGGQFSGGTVDSFGDHRVAMALAVAGTVAADEVLIRVVDSVDTSFPGFIDCMTSIGANILAVDNACQKSRSAPVITIDGPVGSGKGTIARRVATALGWHLLDSGALYRLVALAAGRAGVALDDASGLAEVARGLNVRFDSNEDESERIVLADEDVTRELRTEQAGAGASKVAAIPSVREALLERQRAFQRPPGLVADGRDMGTQVFTDAALKVFLTASAEERAKRRHKQLKDKGMDVSLAALSRDIEDRDRRDSERSVAPLRPAEDARILDSSGQSIETVSQTVLDWVSKL
ncbi:MAG: 3-phosphoshikimate 1-carboxyvinyltransferase [Gammaproteobacteria bacterium]|nr:3-phosphoshikimate 1-carboxyvinyltransferase [Gammaproteobacteria bacterium]